MLELHACCFFGHRKIGETEELKGRLYKLIEDLIENRKTDTFLFGSNSEFDELCYAVVSKLKETYSHIKRICVCAAYPDISEKYENYLLGRYDETDFPPKIRGAGKASYVERNQELINRSEICIVYYNENYVPPKRKSSKRDLSDCQPKSGTRVAYEYAVKKNRTILNVFALKGTDA